MRIKTLIGQKFGNSIVVDRDKTKKLPVWILICECGNKFKKHTYQLIKRNNNRCKDCEIKLFYECRKETFWSLINKTKHCWEWTGPLSVYGYGIFNYKKKAYQTHRFIFELIGQSLPSDKVVDHICRNRKCLNPAHLRFVTKQVNCMENSTSPVAKNAKKTHCKWGHPFSGDNLVIRKTPKTGAPFRSCRTCQRNSTTLSYYKRQKAILELDL